MTDRGRNGGVARIRRLLRVGEILRFVQRNVFDFSNDCIAAAFSVVAMARGGSRDGPNSHRR